MNMNKLNIFFLKPLGFETDYKKKKLVFDEIWNQK